MIYDSKEDPNWPTLLSGLKRSRNLLLVDPGSTHSGVCFMEDGVMKTAYKAANYVVEDHINRAFDQNSIFVIEGMMGRMGGKHIYQTCYQIGRFLKLAEQRGFICLMVYRPEVKTYWLKGKKGGDKEVRNALVEYYGGYTQVPTKKGSKKAFKLVVPKELATVTADAWSALAIAHYVNRKLIGG